MADPLAYLSVIGSWLVAMGALYASYRSGSEQRRHGTHVRSLPRTSFELLDTTEAKLAPFIFSLLAACA